MLLTKPETRVWTPEDDMPTIGKYENGDPVTIDLSRFYHMLIAGEQGAGKSSWINATLAAFLNLPVEFWGIDCKGGVELSPWAKRFAPNRLAVNATDATKILTDLNNMIDIRLEFMEQKGIRKWDTRYGPLIACLMDEGAEVFDIDIQQRPGETITAAETRSKGELKSREQAAMSTARRGRAAGVTLMIATQHPTHDVIPMQIKMNCPLKVCCYVESKTAINVILGEGASQMLTYEDFLDENQDIIEGFAYIKGFRGRAGLFKAARAYWYTDERIEQFMANFNYERWADHYGITS